MHGGLQPSLITDNVSGRGRWPAWVQGRWNVKTKQKQSREQFQKDARQVRKFLTNWVGKPWPGTPVECVRSARMALLKTTADQLGLNLALREEILSMRDGVPMKTAKERTMDAVALGAIRLSKGTSCRWVASRIYKAARNDNLDFLCQVADVLNRPPPKKETAEYERKAWLIRFWVFSPGQNIPPFCFWTDQAIADFVRIAFRDKNLTFDAIRKIRQRLLLKKTTPPIRTLIDLQLLLKKSGR